ncbi:serine/threonine protein kinase/outer membrane protein assembly factor BamB [Catenulispora sp. GP43]|uniref:serine/threonine-protein kinase n=1 Tax=Catenulispora sp. GP43 TaxID=3156263 RepID=UPI003517A4B8
MTRPLRSTDPTRIGDYELTGRIGGGGMGDVFLGRSPSGRMAAVKVVRDLLADDPRFRERFRREVAAARSVSGAYTAAVLDADPDAERPWLATAYIDGPSLLARVSDGGPMDAREARTLGAGLAEALRDIHRAGLVHRDLKPGNVLLAADGPRLIDFGIIRAEDGEGLTETGYVLGSAGYMAPEQAAGGEATAAADVYSLGAVLTFAATGHGPFGDGPTPGVLLRQAAGDRDISAVPEGLRDVVARCLDAVPAERPSTNALLELLSGNASLKETKKAARTKSAAKTRTKDRAKTPELDDLLRGGSSSTQNAEIAVTPTTLMRSTKNAGNAKNAKNAKKPSRPTPQPIPTRRKFLFFGLASAAVAAFGVSVADMPHGDSKTTGAETDDSAPKSATELPTVKVPGAIGGPAKSPAWSNTITNADYLALSGTSLLVKGTTLSAFAASTGTRNWAAPNDTFSQLYDGVLPATADVVYEGAPTGGDLIAVEVGTGAQAWSVPGPASWTTRGLVGASADVVVVWSYIDTAQPDSDGLWGVDPTSRRLLWNTKIGVFEGSPYFSAETGLILLSQPNSHQLTAYNAKTGQLAWTAKDTTPNDDPAFATAIASHGTSIYWAANRLYAFGTNGRPLWPVGATAAGTDGAFHAVIADDTTVYAASLGSLEEESYVAAYKASDGAPLWLTTWPKNFHNPSLECELALGGGNLYIVDHYSGTLVCLDAKTGETNWQYHDPGASPNDDWSVVADDRNVFIGYDSTVRGFVA